MSKVFKAYQRGQEGDPILAAVSNGGAPVYGPHAPPGAAIAGGVKTPGEVGDPTFTSQLSIPGMADLVRTVAIRPPANSPVLPFNADHWHANEQYRIVRTKILQHPKCPRTIVVSSAGAGDGKSVTSINLAGALSLKTEAEVLLIDADFRKAAIHKCLGIPGSPGVAEVLAGKCTFDEAIVRTEGFPNLCVVPAGEAELNPAELLDSTAWISLCAAVRKIFSFVLIDSPPIAAVADYDLLQAVADGVVMVVRPDHTNRRLCLKALESVPREKMIGVVMNCTEDWFLAGAYGYRYYQYDYKQR